MSQQPFALYNPALLPADHLLAEFTARRPLLETLLGIVRSNTAGHPPQHCLLIGARGMGKTTTLWAIAHRVNRDTELARLWQPVVFDEESRRVGDLADFWLESIRQWEHAVGDRTDRAGGLLTQGGAEIENRARQTFLDLVARSGRRSLLLIDNLNDLFSSIHDVEPLHRLRAFLMEESRVMLIGGATRYFDEITNLDRPFFEFFRCFELRALSAEEMKESLLALAEIRGDAEVTASLGKRDGTLKALHLLTGGNPRLVKTFYRLLRDSLQGDVRADLEKLLDEYTPYFKAIVDALPVQQQRLFDAVALAWDPIEVARLSTATRLPSNQVSAQLRALVKSGLITEAAGSPKRKTYLLTDRFSNIHYLMRHGRAARNRLDWFVAMVRSVFPDEESAKVLGRIVREAAECGSDGRNDAKNILQSALNRAELLESRLDLLHATLGESWSSETIASLEEWFDTERAKQDLPEIEIIQFCKTMPTKLRTELGYKPRDSRWWYKLTLFLKEVENWPLVKKAYEKAIEIDPQYFDAWFGLGCLFHSKLKDPTIAENAYRRAIEIDPLCPFPWNNLGGLLQDYLNRYLESETAHRMAIKLNSKWADPWYSLGRLFHMRLARYDDAEAAYREAIKIAPKLAHQWNGLGNLLQEFRNRSGEAEAAYRKAIEVNPKDSYPWNGLANILQEQLHRYDESEDAYIRAIELNPNDALPWNGLGNLLQNHLNRPSDAEVAYRKSIEVNPKYASPWYGLGRLLYSKMSRIDEAESAYRKAIEIDPNHANAWNDLGIVLEVGRRLFDEAQNAYRKAIEIDPGYPRAWNNLGSLLQDRLERPVESEIAYRKAIEIDSNYASPWNGLGNLFQYHLNRFPEAEAAYREAIRIDPIHAYPWNGLGNLLVDRLGRIDEAEVAYRRSIALDPKFAHPRIGLANILMKLHGKSVESQDCASTGIVLNPTYGSARATFLHICGDEPSCWLRVLPQLVGFCVTHRESEEVFQFTLDGFFTLARLTSPTVILNILDQVKDSSPFETLRDACLAHIDREHLHRLSPERQVIAVELMKKLGVV